MLIHRFARQGKNPDPFLTTWHIPPFFFRYHLTFSSSSWLLLFFLGSILSFPHTFGALNQTAKAGFVIKSCQAADDESSFPRTDRISSGQFDIYRLQFNFCARFTHTQWSLYIIVVGRIIYADGFYLHGQPFFKQRCQWASLGGTRMRKAPKADGYGSHDGDQCPVSFCLTGVASAPVISLSIRPGLFVSLPSNYAALARASVLARPPAQRP